MSCRHNDLYACQDCIMEIMRAEIESLKAQLANEKKLSEAISRDCNATALERNDLRSELAECRDKALEEAATVCDQTPSCRPSVSEEIRSLKGSKP